jgi:tetratricopeptide (TPR) repeat protein
MADKRYQISGVLCVVFLLMTGIAQAAGLQDAIREAMNHLDTGDADGALAQLQELQVEHPQSSELRFALGYAWAVQAQRLAQSGDAEKQKSAVAEALAFFDGLLYDPQKNIAQEAAFNRATLLAQEAMRLDPAADFKAAVAALQRAVAAFEEAAKRYPDSSKIYRNLEHLRLKLKELLKQQPDEEQQEEEKPEKEEQPPILSRFGQASTDIPGARAEMTDNTVQLITPEAKEGES